MHRQSHRPGRALIVAACAAITSGCLAEPRFENAYEGELDLCAAASSAAWDERVASCRLRYEADGSCAGVLSFVGTIDGVPVVSSSRDLDRTVVETRPDVGGDLLTTLELGGRAPFFRYVVTLGDIGGPVDVGDVTRVYDLSSPGASSDPPLDDTRLTFTFLLEDGAASKDREHRTGAVTFTRQTADEVVGSFDASNFGGDQLTGCFHAFVTATRSE